MQKEAIALKDSTNFVDQINGEDVTEIQEIMEIIPHVRDKCYDILKTTDWAIEKIATDGDEISYRVFSDGEKIYRVKGIINISAEKLINFLFDEIESNYTWNKHVEESKIIRAIDKDTDLIYQAAKSYGNGFIGARDFVILRHREKYESYNICSYVSADLKSVPERKKYIRGKHGVSFHAARNLKDTENKCELIWIMNTDMKGWIPRKIIDMCKSIGMCDFMRALRQRVSMLED